MTRFDDSLRDYGFEIYRRDNFKCRYCGADGTKSFDTWLTLSRDHLLPKGHPERENSDYIVTACNFCDTADNHYFEHDAKRGLTFDGLTPDELVQQRREYVFRTYAVEQNPHPPAPSLRSGEGEKSAFVKPLVAKRGGVWGGEQRHLRNF